MPHAITALILTGPYHDDAVQRWDLVPVPLKGDLTLFHITPDYTAYRQAKLGLEGDFERPPNARELLFPTENVIGVLAAEITTRPAPTFALVVTDYHGGTGGQAAVVSIDGGPVRPAADINDALRTLGVAADQGLDEFDTVGLGDQRATPDYLYRYESLCDELGV
ncbi:hypothetical protein [Nocardia sp. NPDC003345]